MSIEYRERMFGFVGDRDPLEVQRETADAIGRLIAGRSDAVLRKNPAPGKWSVAQILSHLADAEIVGGFRLRAALAEPRSALAAYDQDLWAQSMRYDEIPAAASLERFAQLRAWNMALYASLREDEWERFAIHAERGRESVRDHARLYAGHDLNHMTQVRRILGA